MKQTCYNVPVTSNGNLVGMADVTIDGDIILEYKIVVTKKSMKEEKNRREKVQFS